MNAVYCEYIHPLPFDHTVVDKMPLFRLSDIKNNEVQDAYLSGLLKIAELKHQKVVIGADNDCILQKILSPRKNPAPIEQRMLPLLEVFKEAQKLFDEVWVSLCVEELAPGGLDASDGIIIARKLAGLGLKNIIAHSGTKDFPALYNRRPTKAKINLSYEQSDKGIINTHPYLASALWIIQHTELKTWALISSNKEDGAQEIAQSVGLSGLVYETDVGFYI